MLDLLMSAPVLLKVLVALVLILVFNRICGQLVVSVAMGTLVLAAWSGHSPAAMGRIVWGRVWSLDNTLLLVVIFQVIALSSQMSATGVMGDLLTAVRDLVSKRAAMAVLPALIGLLPMPGGALFSAPLVESCDSDGSLPAQLKALTNHWFRHVWEYWWPLYPGVLLAMQITDLEVWQFMLIGIPLTLCALVAGRVFLLHRIPPDEEPPRGRSVGTVHRVLVLLLPIFVVIGSYGVIRLLYVGLTHLRPGLPEMNRYVPMLIGLCGSTLVLQLQRPLGRAQWKRVVLSRQAINMVVLVTMVRVYGAFIEAKLPDGTALVAQMHTEMAQWGIPAIAITMLLPLIAGLATGLSMGFVGASFPIVMSLVGDNPDAAVRMATAVLAYGFGYVGQLLSPVHVCLVVTSEYFRTPVLANAAGLIKPVAVVLTGALAMHFLMGLF
jgi:integral membrane protein (TIGR00529 family)